MPLPPPVIKIVLLVSFIIKYPAPIKDARFLSTSDTIDRTGAHQPLWLSSLARRPTDSRIVGIAAWSRPVDGFPADFGKRSAGREPLDQVGIGDVGSSERDEVRKRVCGAAPIPRDAPVPSATSPSSLYMVPILPGCSMIACHKVPIQSLSLFASITTTSRSLVPSATAAIP